MKTLITGVTGFVGPYLADLLLSKGAEVVGVGMRDGNLSLESRMPKAARIVEADIRDRDALRGVLRECHPDQIYHLAAISDVAASVSNPALTYDINVGGSLSLLETLRDLKLVPRIVNVSTAHVYASPEGGAGELSEHSPLDLLTPYAISKYMVEVLAEHYVRAFGFQVVTVRPFNHIGPGQRPDFVCSNFARQIALMRGGQIPAILRTGNLEPERDFTDVRDVVEAYWIAAARGVSGEVYNVASGHPCRMKEIVSELCELAGITVEIETDPAKLRATEPLRLYGSAAKLQALGWEPRIPLKQSLADILNYWMEMTGGPHEGAAHA